MFIIHLHSQFHIRSPNCPLVIAVILKVKWPFSHGRHVVSFYKKGILKVSLFLEDV